MTDTNKIVTNYKLCWIDNIVVPVDKVAEIFSHSYRIEAFIFFFKSYCIMQRFLKGFLCILSTILAILF